MHKSRANFPAPAVSVPPAMRRCSRAGGACPEVGHSSRLVKLPPALARCVCTPAPAAVCPAPTGNGERRVRDALSVPPSNAGTRGAVPSSRCAEVGGTTIRKRSHTFANSCLHRRCGDSLAFPQDMASGGGPPFLPPLFRVQDRLVCGGKKGEQILRARRNAGTSRPRKLGPFPGLFFKLLDQVRRCGGMGVRRGVCSVRRPGWIPVSIARGGGALSVRRRSWSIRNAPRSPLRRGCAPGCRSRSCPSA